MNLDIHWESVAAAAGVAVVVTTAFTTLFRPFADKIWLNTLTRNKDSVKYTLNGWYNVSEGSRKLEKMERDVEELYRRFGELVESQEREFDDFTKRVEVPIATNTRLLGDVADSIEGVGRQVAHIYGLIEQQPWDGRTERRKNDRRH